MPPPVAAARAFDISYRPMTDDDLPFVAALYASTRTDELAPMGWPEAMQAAFLDQQHRAQHQHYRAHSPGAEWLIVEQRGAAIGRLYLGGGAAELRLIDISLLPEQRGAGIGGAILADLIAAARGEGRTIVLHVDPANPARRLYARLGFAEVAETQTAIRMELAA
jgi:GNAT superfamily N-acetyltransferase